MAGWCEPLANILHQLGRDVLRRANEDLRLVEHWPERNILPGSVCRMLVQNDEIGAIEKALS